MNLLIYDPPTELEVDGIFYPVDANYRNCLVILSAFEDTELTPDECWNIALSRLFTEVPGHENAGIPPNIESAKHEALDFLNCGEALKPGKNGRLYSFSHDAKYIRSAIEKSHRLDLQEVGFLHWWKFIYLFFDLDENCFFNQLVAIRQRRKTGKLTKEERQYIADNPEIVNIPQNKIDADTELEDEITKRYKAAVERREKLGSRFG